MSVECIQIHPKADSKNTLANNVAVLKLGTPVSPLTLIDSPAPTPKPPCPPQEPSVFDVVDVKSASGECNDGIDVGVNGRNTNRDELEYEDYDGSLINVKQASEDDSEDECPGNKNYINTICLPEDADQFKGLENHPNETCFVAAWGSEPLKQKYQIEHAVPLLSRDVCNQRLQPQFAKRGLNNWVMKPSEICAGQCRLKMITFSAV